MHSSLPYTLAVALAALYLVSRIYYAWVASSKLQHIPSIGPQGMLGSYLGAYQLLVNARTIIQDGYEKYYGNAFKLPLLSKWRIVITGHDMIEDVRKATDDQLSFYHAVADILQVEHTMDRDIHINPYHVPFVRLSLTRNMEAFFPDMLDEITTAFADAIPAKNGWATITAWTSVRQIVFRVSNRLFVGLPLCRNAEYSALNDEYASALFKTAFIISLVPKFFKPVVTPLLYAYAPSSIDRVTKFIRPLIEERLAKEKQYGQNWPGKPNDLISWLVDKAPADAKSPRALTIRLLAVNFGALHSTSMAVTHAIYDLAAYPSYVPELREEVEAIVKECGLNKDALDGMHKLDSFIKESLRLHGSVEVGVSRKVMKDFTFSNGTTVPAGSTIGIPGYSVHHDKNNYSNPGEFDGFRFYRMREANRDGVKHQSVSVGPDYVVFGNGRHACPGRFFAITKLKTLLAHVLLTYDVQLEQKGPRPANRWFAFVAMPNPTAGLMFRKRC